MHLLLIFQEAQKGRLVKFRTAILPSSKHKGQAFESDKTVMPLVSATSAVTAVLGRRAEHDCLKVVEMALHVFTGAVSYNHTASVGPNRYNNMRVKNAQSRGVRNATKSYTRLRYLYNFTKITPGLFLDYTKITPGLHLVFTDRLQKITDLY